MSADSFRETVIRSVNVYTIKNANRAHIRYDKIQAVSLLLSIIFIL